MLVERSGDQAILEGDNGARPALRFLPINPGFQPGDRVVTSGQDGLLPPGLPVGEVGPLADGKVTVRPYVDWARLDYLSLLRYEGVPASNFLGWFVTALGVFAVVAAVDGRDEPARDGAFALYVWTWIGEAFANAVLWRRPVTAAAGTVAMGAFVLPALR